MWVTKVLNPKKEMWKSINEECWGFLRRVTFYLLCQSYQISGGISCKERGRHWTEVGRRPGWVSDQREMLNNDTHMAQNKNHVCLSCASLPVEIGLKQNKGQSMYGTKKKNYELLIWNWRALLITKGKKKQNKQILAAKTHELTLNISTFTHRQYHPVNIWS